MATPPGRRRLLPADGEEAPRETEYASVRVKAEHPFVYVKRMFGAAQERAADRAAAGVRQSADLRAAPGGVIVAPVRPDGSENAPTGLRTRDFDGPMRPETRKTRAKPDDGDPPLQIVAKSALP